MATKAHIAANRRWNRKHAKHEKHYQYHYYTRYFIKYLASHPELVEVIKMSKERLIKEG